MGTLLHQVAHGLVASDTIMLANLVGGDGLEENHLYFVLAAGLTADDFAVSETDGGSAVVFSTDVTAGSVVRSDVYTTVNDGVMDPPVAPDAPGSCVLSSAAVLAPDGTTMARLDITITQPTSATLRHTVVTVTGGSNQVKVVIPVGQTTGSIAAVVPGLSYTGSAVAYDTFGLASSATVSSAHVAAGDTTAPSVPTGLIGTGAILGIVAQWTAVSNADLSHYELAISTDGGSSFPTVIKTKSTLISVGELSVGTKTIKVRAVDLSGNASNYTSTTTAVARLTDLVTNSTAEVTIDSSGLTVLNGAIFIKDAAGNSVLSASGFGGSWLDFLSSGNIYNSSFESGDTTDIAVTEVGTGSTVVDYSAGAGTSHLPYWVVAASGGTVKIVTDSNAPGGHALEMSGSSSQVNRIYQDVPVQSLHQYAITAPVAWHNVSSASDHVKIYASYRSATHAIIGSRVTLTDATGSIADRATYDVTLAATIDAYSMLGSWASLPPTEAVYVRIEIETTHFTSGMYFRFGSIWITMADPFLDQPTMSFPNIAVMQASTAQAYNFYATYGVWFGDTTGGLYDWPDINTSHDSRFDVSIRRSATQTLTIDADQVGGFLSGGVIIKGGLTLGETDDANEGGQINLDGQGANTDWSIDNYAGDLRFFHGATVAFQLDNAGGTHSLNGGFLTTGAVNTSSTPASWTAAVIIDNAATSTQLITQLNVAGTKRGSIRADSSGNVVFNGSGGGGVYFNHDEGSGPVNVGSGAIGLGSGGANYNVFMRRSASQVLMFDTDGAGATLKAVDAVGALQRGFSGTAFPASPATNDRFYRTNIGNGMWFVYDGTRWLSSEVFRTSAAFLTNQAQPYSATTSQTFRWPMPTPTGCTDIYIEELHVAFQVVGGTALSGSHKWDMVLDKFGNGVNANIGTPVTINSGTLTVWRSAIGSVAALVTTGTYYMITLGFTKTGTPGNLHAYPQLTYRYVAT